MSMQVLVAVNTREVQEETQEAGYFHIQNKCQRLEEQEWKQNLGPIVAEPERSLE